MEARHYIRPVLYTVVCLLFLTYFVQNVVMEHPVFGPPTIKDDALSWNEYLADRHRRNIKKMNLSYDDMMTLADQHVEAEEWDLAMDYYFDAKTLFPTRILPRRGLCYVMLKQCQNHRSYCRYAKREIYYAAQYLDNADLQNRLYIEDLISLSGLTDVVEMEEADALSLIF